MLYENFLSRLWFQKGYPEVDSLFDLYLVKSVLKGFFILIGGIMIMIRRSETVDEVDEKMDSAFNLHVYMGTVRRARKC